MNNYSFTLFDDEYWQNLLPFTFTRPACEIRTGILTIREKWEYHLNGNANFLTQNYLAEKFSFSNTQSNLYVNGRCFPSESLLNIIKQLKEDESYFQNEILIAGKTSVPVNDFENLKTYDWKIVNQLDDCNLLNEVWEIYKNNHQQIDSDFKLIAKGRKSQPLSSSNFIKDPSKIFLEEGARVEFAFLNTDDGPIYVGKNAHIMEGAMIRGPFSLGENSEVKMGTKIYTGTTIGPHCKVGGEINNSVIFGFSNKAHDGFLGNSVIGEWCNLGADTNNSNLKNDYSQVKLWNYKSQKFVNTNQQFCGLMMGDHSKSGINTMFNTGTVIGVCSNIFGDGFPRNYIPNFSWGGAAGLTTYQLDKAFKVAELVMKRREVQFNDKDKRILNHIFENFKN